MAEQFQEAQANFKKAPIIDLNTINAGALIKRLTDMTGSEIKRSFSGISDDKLLEIQAIKSKDKDNLIKGLEHLFQTDGATLDKVKLMKTPES